MSGGELRAVVDALKISLLGEAPRARETSPEAYALYLQGNYFLEQADREGFQGQRTDFLF